MTFNSDSSDGDGNLANEEPCNELGGMYDAGRRHIYDDFKLYGRASRRRLGRKAVYNWVWLIPHADNVQYSSTGIAYDGSTGNGAGRGNEFGPRQMKCPDRTKPGDMYCDIAASVAYFANKAQALQGDEVHTRVGRAPVYVRARFC